MIVKYQHCLFMHKRLSGCYVIHYDNCEDVYFNDISLQAAKADIEQKTEAKFITLENDLIKRKLTERMEGVKSAEKYLILEK